MPSAELSGLLLFDKPKGITSHDAVYLLRRKLGVRRIGHTGTLDPMATGLLIMLVGRATSAQASLQGAAKTYGGTVTFGAETDTWDAEGRTVRECPPPAAGEDEVRRVIEASFTGRITQQVPAYSAVKVGGQALYKTARAGGEVPVIMRHADLRWLGWTLRPGALDFEIECSGGTYIRSVAHELGRALGSAGHLSALRRLAIGAWKVSDAVDAAAFEKLSREEAAALLRAVPA